MSGRTKEERTKHAAYMREWKLRPENHGKQREWNKRYYAKNAETEKVRTAKYRTENPEVIKQQAVRQTDRYRNDPEYRVRFLQWGKESRGRRKESIAEYERKRQRENPGKYKAIRANNLMQRAQRTPSWVDIEKINFFYECCPAGFEVDHMIPLRGEFISGLHIETNLQWLTREQNRVKSNKF